MFKSTNLVIPAVVELSVRYPPKINKIDIVPSPVPQGNSAQLKCIADGYPAPAISWVREGDAILPAGGQVSR